MHGCILAWLGPRTLTRVWREEEKTNTWIHRRSSDGKTAAHWKLTMFVTDSWTGRQGCCIQLNMEVGSADLKRNDLCRSRLQVVSIRGRKLRWAFSAHTANIHIRSKVLVIPPSLAWGRFRHFLCGSEALVHDRAMPRSTTNIRSEIQTLRVSSASYRCRWNQLKSKGSSAVWESNPLEAEIEEDAPWQKKLGRSSWRWEESEESRDSQANDKSVSMTVDHTLNTRKRARASKEMTESWLIIANISN